mmetsp:Transcript_23569/g.63636  ORF Transcript_23569/g.63636 Transcript_23569/m.63636 type:complete len:106 (+) Transcript_23569:532-849(+)
MDMHRKERHFQLRGQLLEARIKRSLMHAQAAALEQLDSLKIESETTVDVILCPTEDCNRLQQGTSVCPLQNPNLTTSNQATIQHLKKFLIDRLRLKCMVFYSNSE